MMPYSIILPSWSACGGQAWSRNPDSVQCHFWKGIAVSYVNDKKYRDGADYHVRSLVDLVSRGGIPPIADT